eukprot:TRINITY_DN701_c0_g2_i2.p1 TRINITY_DN701_c0_g2~~TRINITY_DN701_c0_g2_i2.p1  ORF type:complete len:1066 (-),score=250.94 TRINITY_DN701_c0_g2_i2:410-3577(-)
MSDRTELKAVIEELNTFVNDIPPDVALKIDVSKLSSIISRLGKISSNSVLKKTRHKRSNSHGQSDAPSPTDVVETTLIVPSINTSSEEDASVPKNVPKISDLRQAAQDIHFPKVLHQSLLANPVSPSSLGTSTLRVKRSSVAQPDMKRSASETAVVSLTREGRISGESKETSNVATKVSSPTSLKRGSPIKLNDIKAKFGIPESDDTTMPAGANDFFNEIISCISLFAPTHWSSSSNEERENLKTQIQTQIALMLQHSRDPLSLYNHSKPKKKPSNLLLSRLPSSWEKNRASLILSITKSLVFFINSTQHFVFYYRKQLRKEITYTMNGMPMSTSAKKDEKVYNYFMDSALNLINVLGLLERAIPIEVNADPLPICVTAWREKVKIFIAQSAIKPEPVKPNKYLKRLTFPMLSKLITDSLVIECRQLPYYASCVLSMIPSTEVTQATFISTICSIRTLAELVKQMTDIVESYYTLRDILPRRSSKDKLPSLPLVPSLSPRHRDGGSKRNLHITLTNEANESMELLINDTNFNTSTSPRSPRKESKLTTSSSSSSVSMSSSLTSSPIKDIHPDINVWDEPHEHISDDIDKSNKYRPGTLNNIIIRLSDNSDFEVVDTFFRSYSLICSKEEFWKKLVQRYTVPSNTKLSSDAVQKIKQQTATLILQWMNRESRFIASNPCYTALLDDILKFSEKDIKKDFPSLSNSLSKVILSAKKADVESSDLLGGLNGVTFIPCVHGSLEYYGQQHILLWANPRLVAEQLTLIDHQLYKQINNEELMSMAWMSQDHQTKNILARTVYSLMSRNETLRLWAATAIVIHEKPSERSEIIKQLLTLAQHLYDIKNFHSLMAILAAFNVNIVTKITNNNKNIPKKSSEILKNLSVLLETSNNFKNLRSVTSESFTLGRPTIPYCGIFLGDLGVIDGRSEDIIVPTPPLSRPAHSSHSGSSSSGHHHNNSSSSSSKSNDIKWVNFPKFYQMSQCVTRMLEYQKVFTGGPSTTSIGGNQSATDSIVGIGNVVGDSDFPFVTSEPLYTILITLPHMQEKDLEVFAKEIILSD